MADWWIPSPTWSSHSPEADRVSCGFPGMVRGASSSAHPTSSARRARVRPLTRSSLEAWNRIRSGHGLSKALGKPTKVANDADVQGAAVVQGKGLEVVITLGTGMGCAFFMDGQLMPHLELGHHPFRKDESYDENLGEPARKSKGDETLESSGP